MGRKRTTKSEFDLPPRVYLHHGAFRYVPRHGEKVSLGRNYADAMSEWAKLVKPTAEDSGTITALLQWYLANVAIMKAPRTYRDNKIEAKFLEAALGHIPYVALKPHHVADYLEARGKEAPVRANREKALLAHMYTKAMVKGWVDINPCIGVKRNPEKARERFISDHEYNAVHAIAEPSVRILMELIYRTGQRPDDLIKLGPADIFKVERNNREQRVLRITQGKTGKRLDIAIEGDLERIVDAHLNAPVVWQTFIHTRPGARFTYGGLAVMFRRYCRKAGVADFGMYDIKSKAATDMFRSGTSLEQIQQLLGHASVTTTEIYIKARLSDFVQPNAREIKKETK